MERFIARKQETIRLSGANRDSNFYNPMAAAALVGIANVKQGKGITIRPYGLVSASRDQPGRRRQPLEAGRRLRRLKNFTPNLVGAFSYNMDFAETEADERRINLTRFPLFFPEKRMFFLEGSETFSFSSSVSFQPFFSRKIGLYQGEQVPILFGGKVYGKVGRTNLAFLDVQTEKFAGLPGRNFLALRVTQDILSESKVGDDLHQRQPSRRAQHPGRADFRYATSRFAGDKNLNLATWARLHWNKKRKKPLASASAPTTPNDLWDVVSTYAYYGRSLDPGLGFMLRQGISRRTCGWASSRARAAGPKNLVRQFFQCQRRFLIGTCTATWRPAASRPTPLSFKTEGGESFSSRSRRTATICRGFEVAEGVVLAPPL